MQVGDLVRWVGELAPTDFGAYGVITSTSGDKHHRAPTIIVQWFENDSHSYEYCIHDTAIKVISKMNKT